MAFYQGYGREGQILQDDPEFLRGSARSSPRRCLVLLLAPAASEKQMGQDPRKRQGRFQTTMWPMIADVAAGNRGALGEWYERYKPPLLAYLVYKFRFSPKDAEAIFHDFVHDRVIEKNCVARAKQEKGKFRSFIVITLRNYVIDRFRHVPGESVPLEGIDIPAPGRGADEGDLAWEQARLAAALRCTQAHYEAKGKPAFWDVFWGRIVAPQLHDVPPVSFDALIDKYGFQSPQQAFNALVDAKRTFRKCLKKVSDDDR